MACLLQIAGLVRYVSRLPDDWIGSELFGVTAVSFALISFGAFLRARRTP